MYKEDTKYPEILKIYQRVLEKAKSSSIEDLITHFGPSVARVIKSNIKYKKDIGHGWFLVTRESCFKDFVKNSNKFLKEEKTYVEIIKVAGGFFHVKNQQGQSFGIYTEEYLLANPNPNKEFHLHAKVIDPDGQDRESVLYYHCSHEEFVVKNN